MLANRLVRSHSLLIDLVPIRRNTHVIVRHFFGSWFNKENSTTRKLRNQLTDVPFVGIEGLDPIHLQNRVVDRILGCIYGNALGDAVGLATEFMNKQTIKEAYGDTPIDFPYYIKNQHNKNWLAGDWTDDTDQMILIMETLMETKSAARYPIVLADKLEDWIQQGFVELGDVGGQGLGLSTYKVVKHKDFFTDPHKAAYEVWDSGGRVLAPNGGVMRTSIVGCYHYNNQDEVISNSDIMCKVTHADPRCIASCRAVVTAISSLILDAQRSQIQPPIDEEILMKNILAEVRKASIGLLSENKDYMQEFEYYLTANLEDLKLDGQKAIGYTFKAMGSGFWGLRSKLNFVDTIELLAKEGGDADTNGAVCGALLGCKLGYGKLPRHWLAALPHKQWLDNKVVNFLKISGAISVS